MPHQPSPSAQVKRSNHKTMKRMLAQSFAALIALTGLRQRASGLPTDDALDVNGTVSIHTHQKTFYVVSYI